MLGHSWPTFSVLLPVQCSLFTLPWTEFFISPSVQNAKGVSVISQWPSWAWTAVTRHSNRHKKFHDRRLRSDTQRNQKSNNKFTQSAWYAAELKVNYTLSKEWVQFIGQTNKASSASWSVFSSSFHHADAFTPNRRVGNCKTSYSIFEKNEGENKWKQRINVSPEKFWETVTITRAKRNRGTIIN